jgi:hypothetical protein
MITHPMLCLPCIFWGKDTGNSSKLASAHIWNTNEYTTIFWTVCVITLISELFCLCNLTIDLQICFFMNLVLFIDCQVKLGAKLFCYLRMAFKLYGMLAGNLSPMTWENVINLRWLWQVNLVIVPWS